MTRLIAEHTGQPVERVERDSLRDRWFSAEEALEYGIIDHIVERVEDVRPSVGLPGCGAVTMGHYTIPTVVERTVGRRARLRHLLPAAVGPDHLPRHRDRRRRRQRGHGPAAAPGVGQPRPGDQPVHQLAGRLLQRADRDLRHHAVRPAGRGHHLHGPGVVGGRGAAGGRRAGQAGGPVGTPRCCCTSRRARPRGTLPDLAIQAKEVARVRAEIDEILSRHTGHPVAKIRNDTDRNKTFSARGGGGLRPGRRGASPTRKATPDGPLARGP